MDHRRVSTTWALPTPLPATPQIASVTSRAEQTPARTVERRRTPKLSHRKRRSGSLAVSSRAEDRATHEILMLESRGFRQPAETRIARQDCLQR
jgi:hypothetical protein